MRFSNKLACSLVCTAIAVSLPERAAAVGALYSYSLERAWGFIEPPQSSNSILPACDDCAVTVDLPFMFIFYGYPYTRAWVSSNGFISFDGLNPRASVNSLGALGSKVAIAPLWDDWVLGPGASITYDPSPTRAVFTWVVQPYPGDGTIGPTTFQAVLWPTGQIVFNYGASGGPISATIGIATADILNTVGLEVTSSNFIDSVVLTPGAPAIGQPRAPTVALGPLPAYTNASPLQVTAQITDPDSAIASVAVYRNGVLVATPALGSTGAITASVPLVAEGPNVVRVDAIDATGQIGSQSAQVVYDVTLPVVTVPPPAITANPAFVLAGTASDANGISSLRVSHLGVVREVPLSGTAFQVALQLAEGDNDILVTATDRAGNVGVALAHAKLDTTPPQLALVGPPDGALLATTALDVSFSVRDASATTATVSANGVATTVSVPADGSVSTVRVDAGAEGPVAVTVTVTDEVGNATSATRSLLVDLSAPVLSVELAFGQGPLVDGLRFGRLDGDRLLFNVHVDDLGATTAMLPDGTTQALPRGGGVLAASQVLAEGTNVLTFRATDEVGHEAILTRQVVYDRTPPVATVLLPAPSAAVRGVVEWAANATDAVTGVAAARVRVDDSAWADALRAPDGVTFTASFDTAALADGDHRIDATFADGVGNVATATVSFRVDNGAPTVALGPLADWVWGTVSVQATASDATTGVAELALSVNGGVVQTCVAPNAASCGADVDTTAFLNGPMTFAAHATDGAGNEASAERVVTVDNAAPASFLVSPSAGAVVGSSVLVAVNVTDPGFATVECFVGATSLGVSTDPHFSQTVVLTGRIDGPITVSCTATDLAGNSGTQSVTVMVRNWAVRLEPRSVSLRSRGAPVKAVVEGANVALLLPLPAEAFALSVPGGPPVPALEPASVTATRDGTQVQLRFDRAALADALRAGVSAGVARPGPVRVTLAVGGQVVGGDTIGIVP